MKIVTTTKVLKALEEATGYKGLFVINRSVAKVSGSGESVEDSREITAPVEVKLSAGAKRVVDIFATIDAINSLIISVSKLLLSEYHMGEYRVLSALQQFIRPEKVIPAANVNGIAVADLLESYQLINDIEGGVVLSPQSFENAELQLLKMLNPKCQKLTDVVEVNREIETLNDEIIYSYPVNVDGQYLVYRASEVLTPFALRVNFLEDSEYVIDVNRNETDKLLRLVSELREIASKRES